MPLNYQTARTIVLKHLKTHNVRTDINARNILNASQLGGDADDAGDCALIYRVFHDLYLDRVIVAGTSDANGDKPMMWPFCTLTPYGAKIVSVDEWQPYDPDGYLDALKRALPNLDATIFRYLGESLGCLNRDLLLASAVMLGCAAEKAILLLGDALSNAIADPAKKAKYDREWSAWQIAKKYQALWARIQADTCLPVSLSNGLQPILDRTFELIRDTRNKAGHPSGDTVEREVALGNYLQFPSFCKRIYALLDHYAKTKATF